MQCTVKYTQVMKQKSACLIVGVFSNGQLTDAAKAIDIATKGYITKLFQTNDLSGELAETLLLHDINQLPSKRLLIVGCGKLAEFNENAFRKVVYKAMCVLKTTGAQDACCYLTDIKVQDRAIAWNIRQAIEQSASAFYKFVQFKSKPKVPTQKPPRLLFNVADKAEVSHAEQALQEGLAIVAGMRLTKDLGNTPANVCTPSFLAAQAQQLAKQYKTIKVNVLTENAMRKLGMGALLAVAQGSAEPAKLIVVHYQGETKAKAPVVLIGKGVTFDTGGISLKPPANMDEMKYDMCGAASILGAIKAVAELSLPINVIGILPTTENMPDGKAVKPGDIITTMSGQTVEILNTDAEGRLILCDALTYAERFKPAAVIDVATLTGAVITALGSVASGLMSNNDALAQAIQQAGIESWDRVWPLPLWEDYQGLINSPFADMANIGQGNDAKSIVAGCFLARFAKKFPWAHLDVAGTAWPSSKEKIMSGRPVALLVQYLINFGH